MLNVPQMTKKHHFNDHNSGSDESLSYVSSYVTNILTSALGFFGTFMRDITCLDLWGYDLSQILLQTKNSFDQKYGKTVLLCDFFFTI